MDIGEFKTFGEALAIGLLIGMERYKDRAPGEQKSAGVRTFTLFSLLGAVCGLLGQPAITLAIFAGLLALICLGYYRESTETVGLTSTGLQADAVAGASCIWPSMGTATSSPL